jgi:hypothetical protein
MLSRQVNAALWVAAAPGDLLRTGSSPMSRIAVVATARISPRRRSQADKRDFYHRLLSLSPIKD